MNLIVNQLNKITERYNSYENEDELKQDIESLLFSLNESELMKINKPVTLSSVADELNTFYFDTTKAREEFFIPSGYKDFDKELSGWRKGELVVIGARPGMGKTQLMIDMAVRLASQDVNCGVVSLEQNKTAIGSKFVSNISSISQQQVVKGIFNPAEKEQVRAALVKLKTLPIWVVDQHQSSITLILERCKQLITEQKVEVLFLDYVQLIGTIHRRQNRETELALITRSLKRLAVEYNVVIIVLSQLSRSVETRASGSKRPMLSDLRESGAIEQDADKVIFLYRPEYYGLTEDENGNSTKGFAELIVAKNKIGYTIDIPLQVKKDFTGFADYEGPKDSIEISWERLTEINK
ncbi:MAG: DnaB-like helicase C-terminal domain-containing protein [Bacteroidetes bacterium]|nr:DnaB-like helicase C-terminal domain-containing protein [Bacteroidota bacterium]